jgi:DNA polymerase III subunit beta
MNIIIERAALLRSLSHVQSVVERRNTIPILANVLLKARDGELDLAATDMDLEIVETVPATVNVAGGITAPAHTLYDIVRKLPDGSQVELKVDADGSQMVLRSGRSNFKLSCLPVEDFPQLSGGELRHRFALTAAELRRLIDRTRFAISTEETRYYLNGIYLHAARAGAEPALRAVATDGHRLARVEMALPDGAGDIPGVIVPRKTINEVRKLIDEAADRIELSVSENKIRFAFDTVVVTSKLIDGTFPDYERVIPTGNDKMLEVDAKLFAAAVDRVATISTEKSRAVKLAVGRNVLTLSATSPEAGSATEELEVEYQQPAIEIGFNSRYLLDITQQIEGATANFALADAASPTIVRDAADPSALYVLMPMRV